MKTRFRRSKKIKHDIQEPKLTDHEVLIKVKRYDVNPIDAMVFKNGDL